MGIVSIILIVAFFALPFILKRLLPSKGDIGEKRVARILEKLPGGKYSVINNLLLNNSGHTSQVDHVVVSVYGIFVIETRLVHSVENYSLFVGINVYLPRIIVRIFVNFD